jgi:hypothetical protein
MPHLIVIGLLVLWVLVDGFRRGANAILWAIGTALLPPVVLPFYLAKRPLEAGEVRAGGTAWNVLKNFAIVWTVLMAWLTIASLASIGTDLPQPTSDAGRVGQAIGAMLGLGFLGALWFFPMVGAMVLGFFLKNAAIVEVGPTGSHAPAPLRGGVAARSPAGLCRECGAPNTGPGAFCARCGAYVGGGRPAARAHWGLLLGGGLLGLLLFGLFAAFVAHRQASVPPAPRRDERAAARPSAAAQGAAPPRAPRSGAPAARPGAESWRVLKSWSGSGIKTTETFAVGSREWRIQWRASNERAAGILQIYVHDEAGHLVDLAANHQGAGSDTSYVRGRPGRYYLRISSGNVDWRVVVEVPAS